MPDAPETHAVPSVAPSDNSDSTGIGLAADRGFRHLRTGLPTHPDAVAD
jgi:hypothetical protein